MSKRMMFAALAALVLLGMPSVVAATGDTGSGGPTDEQLSASYRSFVEANGSAGAGAADRDDRAACLLSQQYSDPLDVIWLDIVLYAASYHCAERFWDFPAATADLWYDWELYGYFVEIDRDRNASTGCKGADSVAGVIYDGFGLSGSVFATPSCDDRTWVTTGTAYGFFDGNSIIDIEFPASAIAYDREFRWALLLEDDLGGGTDVDRAPSSGWRDMRVPCGIGSTAFTKVTARSVYGVYDDLVGGDYNGDSVDDLFFYGRGGNPDGLLQGSGSGLLAVSYRPPVNLVYDDIVSGDFNGDSADDIFFYGAGPLQDGYLLASPGGFALTPVRNSVQVTRSYDGLASGDFNGDGLDDIFYFGSGSRPDGLLKGTINGLRAVSGSVQVSRSYDAIAAGDFNRDGYDDVAFYGRGTAPEGLLLGGPGWLHASAPGAANGVYDSIAPGDFNGDGYSDLFFYAPGTDCEGLLRGTPSGMIGVSTPGVDGVYDGYTGGDFNGDGRDDLFFYGRGSRPEGQLLGS